MKNIITLKILFMLLVIVFLGAGCVPIAETNKTKLNESTVNQDSLYVYSNGYIKRVRLEDGKELDSYPLPAELSPLSFDIQDTFRVNSAQDLVVWFVPTQGLIRLNTQDRSISAVYKPTSWFLENPYFQFYGDTNLLVLIDKKGSEMVWVDVDKNQVEIRPVPFPFGTIFAISPDLQKIVFVEGYRQTKSDPAYMVTDIKGNLLSQFNTLAEISNRKLVAWSADSKSVIAVENNGILTAYPIDKPKNPMVVYAAPGSEKIVDLSSIQTMLYFRTGQYIYSFDQLSKIITKRLPIEILNPLNNPRVIWVNKDAYYVEEDVKSFEYYHKRLWIADWHGDKKVAIPEYGFRISL